MPQKKNILKISNQVSLIFTVYSLQVLVGTILRTLFVVHSYILAHESLPGLWSLNKNFV